MLAVHETAEEEVVYPLLRRLGDHGTSVAEARIAEEDEAKDVLSELETLDPAGAEFATRINVLHQAVLGHAENEDAKSCPCCGRIGTRITSRSWRRPFMPRSRWPRPIRIPMVPTRPLGTWR